MNVPELSFQLNINCETDFDSLRNWFREKWPDFNIEWQKSGVGSTDENWIELDRNFEYDPHLVNTDNGWMYYPFIIRVFTKKNSSPTMDDFSKQVEFARSLKKRLEELGCTVRVDAEFGALLA